MFRCSSKWELEKLKCFPQVSVRLRWTQSDPKVFGKAQPNENANASVETTYQPGDDNFEHKMLVGMKLVVPCNTWEHDDARQYFDLRYRDKTTTAFVRKVFFPNTKKVSFDLEFPEIPQAIYKTWAFPLEYVLKYVCGLH